MNNENEENKNEAEALEVEEIVPEDGEGATETAEAKLKKLREELKQCQTDKQEYLTLSQRLKADYLNLEKATETRRGEIVEFANQALLLDLLDLADSFELAFANQVAWAAVAENWRQGVEYIYTKLAKLLEVNGLIVINPLGEPFDPASHESIESVVTSKEEEAERVVEVLKKGYRLRGKVLRPAQVKVGAFSK
ncbi:MAG TPA: nucleotide exchange factor GrpE [Candidatus Paceibacterota bacterium]